jgi:hypothetical protein
MAIELSFGRAISVGISRAALAVVINVVARMEASGFGGIGGRNAAVE